MRQTSFFVGLLLALAAAACASKDSTSASSDGATAGSSSAASSSGSGSTTVGGTGGNGTGGTASGGSGGTGGTGSGGGAGGSGGSDLAPCATTPAECTAAWEQAASDRFDALVAGPVDDLAAFLKAAPKGGDLHNHLTGAVYAETFLGWALADGDCIDTTTFVDAYGGTCSSAAYQAVPTSGAFFDAIVDVWSMKDFVPGVETGHDHFFATFGKFGAVAGYHHDDSVGDLAKRAVSENQLYIETMLNLGTNVGSLAASTFSGTVHATDLPSFYANVVAAPTFASQLAKDLKVVTDLDGYFKQKLGCSGAAPPAACGVEVRFIAQISRTGSNDTIFGQMISAFEMAAQNGTIVALNLSSPEDDTASLNNYDLHMAMLDFLHQEYSVTNKSPLHITLHAGELSPAYLPSGYSTANTFHVREAVEIGHAERIGHGLDILSETDAPGLLAEMSQNKVLVEVCLSSNIQILDISGAQHPLRTYMQNQVPVALATDDQGVSRSSLAGEALRGVLDQNLTYREIKAMTRASLEHAFLPGESLWSSIDAATPVAACAVTATMGLGDAPNAACQTFLDGSERARIQWTLERRFRVFEGQQ